MKKEFITRNLSKLYSLFTSITGRESTPREKSPEGIRDRLAECANAKGGEVSARLHAADLAKTYLDLDDEGRHNFLRVLALDFGPDTEQISIAYQKYKTTAGTSEQWESEAVLRAALYSPRERILTRFNAIPMGVKFLVDMRVDILRFMKESPELKILDSELKRCLASWFDVGFLELVRLTWDSPAALLEKIVEYEAVHEIHSWKDLKNRLDSDRRCYAFFHPKMAYEPLIFVQVALLKGLADNVQQLLDIQAPVADSAVASTAIFYSITNTQEGLRGISFGNFLLKRVIDSLKRDFPKLKTFATLSPIPGMMRWLKNNPGVVASACYVSDWERLDEMGIKGPKDPVFQGIATTPQEYACNSKLMEIFKDVLLRVAAQYLLEVKRDGMPQDPVTRFHLGNGARVEKLNWMADNSEKGLVQSWGIMVNYLYDPDRLEENVEAYTRDGRIAASSSVEKLAVRISALEAARARRKMRQRKRAQ